MYKLSQRSLRNINGIDFRLILLIGLLLKESPYDFIVTEGLRTVERQKQLVADSKSQTMKSKHIDGKAFDIAILINGKVTWDFKYYEKVAAIFKELGKALGFNVTWGGDWKNFKDGPHFQIND